jgi:hypothetical protein
MTIETARLKAKVVKAEGIGGGNRKAMGNK